MGGLNSGRQPSLEKLNQLWRRKLATDTVGQVRSERQRQRSASRGSISLSEARGCGALFQAQAAVSPTELAPPGSAP
jgi:hypothetical protein